jgi:quinoprotein glucose dehydrogenase
VQENNLSQVQTNPIVVDSVLYGISPGLAPFAVHAATGEALWSARPWRYHTKSEEPNGVLRGVAYWARGRDRRILFTAGSFLYALDATNGRRVVSFGDSGRVDLRAALDRAAHDLFVQSTTPGVVYKDLLIMGTRVDERSGAAPGHIRAYDVRSGELAWIFHTIPHPGEYGYETWPPDAWTRIGGVNSWAGMALDSKRGVVYAPTGSAAFDFYGGDRVGQNLFANSVLALDAETGLRLWHYQTVRHDLWDRDLPSPPTLVTVTHQDRRIDAVAQITKSGYVFLLDRDTGESLFDVEEVPVAPSDLEGEEAWPTQPIPVRPRPFARQRFAESDVTDLTPESTEHVLRRLREVRSDGQFVPPSVEGTMIFPGFDGGGEWGGAAVDPARGILYVNSNEMPWILEMVRVQDQDNRSVYSHGQYLYTINCAACHRMDFSGNPAGGFPSLVDVGSRLTVDSILTQLHFGKGFMPSFGHLSIHERRALAAFLLKLEDEESGVNPDSLPDRPATRSLYAHTGWNRFLDLEGYPAVKPPWGTLNAIDLNTGDYLWTVPLGEYQELTERGIPQTGTENYGGPVVTAGGLLFIGATRDEKFRAFSTDTGEVLWEADLPAGGYATPATYEVGGRQYVVIAAGGGKMGTPSGDTYVAFRLPSSAVTAP